MTHYTNVKSGDSGGYYRHVLAAERLKRCYEAAPPRVRQYLEAEVAHVVGKIRPSDSVLELGCGYGRVLEWLAVVARIVVGIDNSVPSLRFGQDMLRDCRNCHLLAMNAIALGFADRSFDVVVCIQNGISAFKVDPGALVRECVRVTKPGGTVLLSSYAKGFWPDRLKWFEMQAEAGLVGEIDRTRTRDGLIVCKDGFAARTAGPEEFRALCAPLGLELLIEEVDGSSLFCEIRVRT